MYNNWQNAICSESCTYSVGSSRYWQYRSENSKKGYVTTQVLDDLLIHHEWTHSPNKYKKHGQPYNYKIAEREPYFVKIEEIGPGGTAGVFYSNGMNVITTEGVRVVGLLITSDTFHHETVSTVKRKVEKHIGKSLRKYEENIMEPLQYATNYKGFHVSLIPQPWLGTNKWMLEVIKY